MQPCARSVRNSAPPLSWLDYLAARVLDLYGPSKNEAWHTEITAVEAADPCKLFSVDHFDGVSGSGQNVQAPQRLNRPIHVDDRKGCSIGDIDLGNGHDRTGHSDRLSSRQLLTKQVGDSLQS